MINDLSYFIFVIDNQQFAIPLVNVFRVIRAQAFTKITDPPPFISGLIDYFGEVIPVVNLRKRLGLPEKEITLSDRFLIVNLDSIKLALVTDEVTGLMKADQFDLIESSTINKEFKFVKILMQDKRIILIYNLEELLKNLDIVDILDIIQNHAKEDTIAL